MENNSQNSPSRKAPSEKNMIQSLVRLVNAGFKAPVHADPREMAKEWSRALVGINDHELDVCITHIIQNNRWWPMPVEVLEAYDELFYQKNVREYWGETGSMERVKMSKEVEPEEIPF